MSKSTWRHGDKYHKAWKKKGDRLFGLCRDRKKMRSVEALEKDLLKVKRKKN